jgi:hypothetical protein
MSATQVADRIEVAKQEPYRSELMKRDKRHRFIFRLFNVDGQPSEAAGQGCLTEQKSRPVVDSFLAEQLLVSIIMFYSSTAALD